MGYQVRRMPTHLYLFVFIALFPNFIFSQSKLKKSEAKIAPIAPFTFLAEGGRMSVANTVRLEQLDVLIGLNFSEIKWKESHALLNTTFQAFEKLGFFSDEALKREFGGFCRIGYDKFDEFCKFLTESFRFKNEAVPDLQDNICSVTPLEIKLDDLKAELVNIVNRFNRINENWTPQQVKDSEDAKTILFEYCSYMNDFAIVYEQKASDMLAALEELSDGFYPEILFGNTVRNCTYSINGDGERYHVVECKGTSAGFRCQVEITQTINLREYIRTYPVHYDGVAIAGELDSDIFARTVDVLELKYLECDDEYSDIQVCIEKKIPDPCKKSLDSDDINGVIKNCNFSKATPSVGTVLPHGGLLIQGSDIEILNGATRLTNRVPIAIYSPEILTVKSNEEDYIFPPAIIVENLIVVESKLTDDEIALLHSTERWNELVNEIEIENYIDMALIILQIIVLPTVFISLYLSLKQRKAWKNMAGSNLRRYQGTENLRNNQHFLLKRVRKK